MRNVEFERVGTSRSTPPVQFRIPHSSFRLGSLVLVFGFLDLYMTEKSVTFWFAIGILSLSGFLLVSGILAEITRKE